MTQKEFINTLEYDKQFYINHPYRRTYWPSLVTEWPVNATEYSGYFDIFIEDYIQMELFALMDGNGWITNIYKMGPSYRYCIKRLGV